MPNLNLEIQLYSTVRLSEQKKTFYQNAMNQLTKIVSHYLEYRGIPTNNHFLINCHLVGKQKIQSLNKEFRSKDKITDVLSFPVHENLRSTLKNSLYDNREILSYTAHENFGIFDLGDIYICQEKMYSQSKEFKIAPIEEFFHLFIHGFLHLLGYDHEISREEEEIMENEESTLLDSLYKIYKKK